MELSMNRTAGLKTGGVLTGADMPKSFLLDGAYGCVILPGLEVFGNILLVFFVGLGKVGFAIFASLQSGPYLESQIFPFVNPL